MTLALGLDTASGRVSGDADITYNSPFPCVNGKLGVTGAMRGVLMHTMVGFLAGTIAVFNDPARQASAHFGVSQAGRIHQFGPVGKGWEAWHAYAANLAWYGIEFEDAGNPDIPISDAALTAGAQLTEFLSRFAGFPLQVCDDCAGQGFAYHRMCDPWNLNRHSCPDSSFTAHVRSGQRAEIIRRAHLIRDPAPVPPAEPIEIHADGHATWGQLAARHGLRTQHLLWQTAVHRPSGFGPLEGQAADALAGEVPPAGTVIYAGTYPG